MAESILTIGNEEFEELRKNIKQEELEKIRARKAKKEPIIINAEQKKLLKSALKKIAKNKYKKKKDKIKSFLKARPKGMPPTKRVFNIRKPKTKIKYGEIWTRENSFFK